VATGIATTTLANKMLDHIRGGTAFTQPPGLYVKLHIGDPGPTGTANASAVTTRSQATFAVPSGGSMGLTDPKPSWAMTTTEDITHVSVWDAPTSGNFLWSAVLSAPQSVVNTNTLNLDTLVYGFVPLAT
jgi:hypothetical protein